MSNIRIIQRYYSTLNSFKTEDCNGAEVWITFEQMTPNIDSPYPGIEFQDFKPIPIERRNT